MRHLWPDERATDRESIKSQSCRSGRCAGKAIDLTWGGLRPVPLLELREPQGALTRAQESADGIVGHAVGTASEALQEAEPRIGRAGNDGPNDWKWQEGPATHEGKA